MHGTVNKQEEIELARLAGQKTLCNVEEASSRLESSGGKEKKRSREILKELGSKPGNG